MNSITIKKARLANGLSRSGKPVTKILTITDCNSLAGRRILGSRDESTSKVLLDVQKEEDEP